jgi:hypothetical protein
LNLLGYEEPQRQLPAPGQMFCCSDEWPVSMAGQSFPGTPLDGGNSPKEDSLI